MKTPRKRTKDKAPSQASEMIGGFTPTIHVRTARAPCQLRKIKWKSGKSTNNQKVEKPRFLVAGDTAEVVFRVKNKPLVCTPYDVCKPLARMAAINSNAVIMLGKIVKVK